MMKLYNIISESNDSNVTYTELKPVERKFLQFMIKKGITYNDDKLIYKFIKDTLAIEDLETQMRLINLYMLNALTAMKLDKGFLEMDKVVELDQTDTNDYKKVLAEFKGVPERLVFEVFPGQLDNEAYHTYLAEYRVFDVARGKYETYLIARDGGEAWNAAATHLMDMIYHDGYESFNQDWLLNYVRPDEEEIENHIESNVIDRSANDDEEDLRDELFGYRPRAGEDYEGATDEIEFTKEEIKKLTLEIQEKEFKKDNIESELIVLEKDIERLDYYSDDETNYRDMEYSEEIEELQQRYDDYKIIFEELEIYLEESYRELDKFQSELEEYKEIIKEYSGENLTEKYVEEVTADKTYEALQDIESWIDDMNMDIAEAEEAGYITIEKEDVIEGAINSDGVGHWISGYDGYENEETITLEDGNYSDTFYLFRTE